MCHRVRTQVLCEAGNILGFFRGASPFSGLFLRPWPGRSPGLATVLAGQKIGKACKGLFGRFHLRKGRIGTLGLSLGAGLLPSGGWAPFAESPLENLLHMALPALTLA